MNTFTYTISMKVEVEAFDESDAMDALVDSFGVGDQYGVTVVEVEYKEVTGRKKK